MCAARPSSPDSLLSQERHHQRERNGNNQIIEQGYDTTAAEVSSNKKKKRRRAHADLQITPDSTAELAEESTGEPSNKKKKKSTKSTKSKQTDTISAPQSVAGPASHEDSPQASAAAFLSAIVAAATGAPDTNPVHLPDPSLGQEVPPFLSPFPPLQFPFSQSNPFGHGMPDGALQTPNPMPLSDLTYGSNEDVLRVIQELDLSKITNVLKTLGEAAAAANLPSFGVQPPFAAQSSVSMTPLNQTPAPSHAILGRKSQTRGDQRTPEIYAQNTTHDQHTNPDHAYLLATKWLSANKLAELVRTQGLVYKKGKFSATEERQLKDAIANYRVQKGISEEQMLEIIFPHNEKNKDNAFWSEITAAVPQRPIIAVYHHVRRTYHPMKMQGKWTPEQDGLLKQAVADLGQQWEKVSERVGRMSSDCRDRWRNHIVNREIRVTGPWSKDEEEELTRIVTSMTAEQGRDLDNDVFWGRVSELMGGRRGRQQCRIKWTDALSKTVKNDGQKPRWSQQDAFILVHKIDSLNVHDDTEIDWKTIPDPHWNLWSAHTLQRRWLTMKRSIKGYEDMTHQEIMDILRVKKAHLPAPSGVFRKRKERKVTSATTVADDPQREYSDSGSGDG